MPEVEDAVAIADEARADRDVGLAFLFGLTGIFDMQRKAAAAAGFPAGVGESCSGFRRMDSAPMAASSGSASKNPGVVGSYNRAIIASASFPANS